MAKDDVAKRKRKRDRRKNLAQAPPRQPLMINPPEQMARLIIGFARAENISVSKLLTELIVESMEVVEKPRRKR